jgi:ketosteroid isomerase-like protein
MSKRDEQIEAVLKGYTEGFIGERANVDALLQLWDDQQAEELTYLPAESDVPVLGIQGLREYYTLLAEHYVITAGAVSNVHVRPISGDLTYVLFDLTWAYSARDRMEQSIAFASRASIVLRKRGQRWYYVQMHESVTWHEPTP